MLGFFVSDMLFNFTLAFPDPDNGELVYSSSRIAERYLFSTWFVIDFISCFPFEHLASNGGLASSVKLTKIFKLARMVRVGKVLRRVKRIANKTLHLVSGSSKKVVQLIKLLGVMLMLMHWISCGWNLVGFVWRCDGHYGGISDDINITEGSGSGAPLFDNSGCLMSKFGQNTFWQLYTSCLFQVRKPMNQGGH